MGNGVSRRGRAGIKSDSEKEKRQERERIKNSK